MANFQQESEALKTAKREGKPLPGVSIFQDANFVDHRIINPDTVDKTKDVVYFAQDDLWNDEISSIIVHSGIWEFFVDARFSGQMVRLGPGRYANEIEIGLPNDSISSYRCVGLT